jgi:hypothetical protein
MDKDRKPRFVPRLRVSLLAGLGAVCLMMSIGGAAAAAAPQYATDWFVGTAAVATGQTSPVTIEPTNVSVRADGAIGLGYKYVANGKASGQLPGSFAYEEHGYLYFRNPTDPNSLVGSRFVSGVFKLSPANTAATIAIADTAPQNYKSGVQTLLDKLPSQTQKKLDQLAGLPGPLTFGYFTFTNPSGTFTGYATPDFVHFAIGITFETP